MQGRTRNRRTDKLTLVRASMSQRVRTEWPLCRFNLQLSHRPSACARGDLEDIFVGEQPLDDVQLIGVRVADR